MVTLVEPVVTTALRAEVPVKRNWWALATFPTVNATWPVVAAGPAVTLTRFVELLTETGFQAVAPARLLAWVVRAAKALFRSCSEVMFDCSVVTFDLRLVW